MHVHTHLQPPPPPEGLWFNLYQHTLGAVLVPDPLTHRQSPTPKWDSCQDGKGTSGAERGASRAWLGQGRLCGANAGGAKTRPLGLCASDKGTLGSHLRSVSLSFVQTLFLDMD